MYRRPGLIRQVYLDISGRSAKRQPGEMLGMMNMRAKCQRPLLLSAMLVGVASFSFVLQ
jgi:hypothetical protein